MLNLPDLTLKDHQDIFYIIMRTNKNSTALLLPPIIPSRDSCAALMRASGFEFVEANSDSNFFRLQAVRPWKKTLPKVPTNESIRPSWGIVIVDGILRCQSWLVAASHIFPTLVVTNLILRYSEQMCISYPISFLSAIPGPICTLECRPIFLGCSLGAVLVIHVHAE